MPPVSFAPDPKMSAGIYQRSASRHLDWTGPDYLAINIQELREIADWEKPIYVKVGATRTFNDVKLAVHAGADVVVIDGMQGGTAATQTCFIENVGIPTLAAVRQTVDALEDLNMKGTVQLIVSGGIRSGADIAKALAMGAVAVAIGQGMLMAPRVQRRHLFPERRTWIGGGPRGADRGSRCDGARAARRDGLDSAHGAVGNDYPTAPHLL